MNDTLTDALNDTLIDHSTDFLDEEPTVRVQPQTLDEVDREWRAERALELANRPTRNIRPLKCK